MKTRLLFVLAAVAAFVCRAEAQTLKDARQRLLRGNYAEAQEQFTELLKDAKTRIPATIGLSRAWEAEGEYDKATATVEGALKDAPQDADLLARRAELHYLRGRWSDAEASANAALKTNKDHFLAHWIIGQVLRDKGNIEEADKTFLWFIRTYNAKNGLDAEELLLVGLAACERARWHNLTDQFRFVLNDVWADAIKMDKDFWPAEYEAGRLLQEKYNKPGAFKAFEKVLSINPRAAGVFASKGQSALARFEIKDAELAAQKALQINPRLTDALRLLADVHLFSGELTEALKVLAKARDVNPREETTLARVAACLHLQRQQAELAMLIKDVEAHNAKPAVFYHEFAQRLEERRLYDEAEKYYLLAEKLQPQLPYIKNGLGLLYMRQGREDEAKKILEKAFDADPFNVRVHNSLKVLDHLAKYTTLKTEHFHLRYDPGNDKVLAAFMAEYLEEIYAELAAKFNYKPKGPILIEVFNRHEMFSGRVVALPDLHTIGACTGTLVAMVSPRDKSKVIAKPFNWVRVLRHELVHVFNLEQTRMTCPHWFTEGLAVMYEGSPPPPTWHTILAEKFHAGKLMNLDNVLLGFIRPSSPDEWHQAYYQSLLYVEYLIKTHGQDAVGHMLEAYREGLDTGPAIERVCKVSKAQFEKGYRAFVAERVRKTGGTSMPSLSFKELKAAHAKDPKNADIAAQLADRYYSISDKVQAGNLADAVLADNKTHPLAGYVKARILIDKKETAKAVELLEAVSDGQPPDARVFKLLGKLHFDAKKNAEAARALERGKKLQPHDPYWLVQLGRIYVQTGDKARLIDVLKELVPTDADDLVARRKLAQMLAAEGQHAEAEKYARQALEIDVLDREAQQVLEAALTAQKKDDELARLRKLLAK